MIVKEFMYGNKNSYPSIRKVFVIKEDNEYIEGIDLNLLNDDEVKEIENFYKNFIPVKCNEKVFMMNYNSNWNRAYRAFSKNLIKND